MKATIDLDLVFQALSDPTRRGILAMLREGGQSTGSLADAFPITRPAVSRHLRVLYDAGLVERRKEGRNQIYSLAPETVRDARRWLERYTHEWRRGLERLRAHVEGERAGGSHPSAELNAS